MYELKIITKLAAAHNLKNFKGKCEKLHGHNWKIEVVVEAEKLGEDDLVVDFADIKAITNEVINELDHTYINEHPYFKNRNASSELLATYIFQEVDRRLQAINPSCRLKSVSAWESDTSMAKYIRD